MREDVSQMSRFIGVGLGTTTLNYAVFWGLLDAGMPYLAASALGFLVGVLAGYPFNRDWTFKYSAAAKKRVFVKYIALYVASLALGQAALYACVDGLGMNAMAANVLVIGLTTVTNFIGTKWWVFKA